MLANSHPDIAVRAEQFGVAIKRVYASTFSQHAKRYIQATPYRLEEEKMAVIIQQAVGAPYGSRFYPDSSGGRPVEIDFAARLANAPDEEHEFPLPGTKFRELAFSSNLDFAICASRLRKAAIFSKTLRLSTSAISR